MTAVAVYRFFTTCVEWAGRHGRGCSGDAGQDIRELVDSSTEVSRRAFLSHVDRRDLAEVEVALGYSSHPSQGLTMAGDWHVGYYKGRFCGKPVYYFRWSGIEHIFMRGRDTRYLEG